MNKENCQKCFTCETNVLPHFTKADIDKAKLEHDGRIPDRMLIEQKGDGQCIECQKCFSQQGNCNQCVRCEKCFEGQMPSQGKQSVGQGITYFIFPTNECNLRCDYCYATKNPTNMTKDMATKVMAWIIFDEEERLPNRNISIQFFGGEPTLRWDIIEYVVDTMKEASIEWLGGRNIRFGMTTNATLLTEEGMQWLSSNGITPLFSIDGRHETHDKHRVYADGRGSWSNIDIDLILKYFKNPEIRPTIMPDTVEHWIEDVRWFHSKGLYMVATEVDYSADWTDEAMAKAWVAYNEMADLYIELKRKGQKAWFKFIDDGRNFLGSRKQTGHVCGVGRGSIAIDASGKLYSCQRYASFSDPSVSLGDVENGFDMVKLQQANSLKREDMFPDPDSGFNCETCHARYRCRGSCNAENYQELGDRRKITASHCKFLRMWTTIAFRALASTGELWDKFGVK